MDEILFSVFCPLSFMRYAVQEREQAHSGEKVPDCLPGKSKAGERREGNKKPHSNLGISGRLK